MKYLLPILITGVAVTTNVQVSAMDSDSTDYSTLMTTVLMQPHDKQLQTFINDYQKTALPSMFSYPIASSKRQAMYNLAHTPYLPADIESASVTSPIEYGLEEACGKHGKDKDPFAISFILFKVNERGIKIKESIVSTAYGVLKESNTTLQNLIADNKTEFSKKYTKVFADNEEAFAKKFSEFDSEKEKADAELAKRHQEEITALATKFTLLKTQLEEVKKSKIASLEEQEKNEKSVLDKTLEDKGKQQKFIATTIEFTKKSYFGQQHNNKTPKKQHQNNKQ